MSESAARSALFTDQGGRRRRRRKWLRALWIAAAVWLGLNAVAAWLMFHPRAIRPFVRFQDVPKESSPDPAMRTLEARTDDGLTLRGTAFVPAAPRGVIVVLHGVGGSRLSGMAHKVVSWGYVGVSFDFRGHGASDGSTTSFGYEERRDVAAILGVVRAAWPGLPVGAWGQSLGGAALAFGAETTRDLRAVLLESVYSTLASSFERRFDTYAPSWLLPLAKPTWWFADTFGGLDAETVQPPKFVGKLQPDRTLLATGEKDPWATTGDLKLLSAALPGAATHVVPGAEHHNVWRVGGDAYFAVVRAFFDARLK
jgi:uncharacterized protein